MARLREKIKDLQTKYGISEDAARELLSLHDNDLEDASNTVKELQGTVVRWNQWYQENAPGITASFEELDNLKAKLGALESAGVTLKPTVTTTATPPKPDTQSPDITKLLDERDQAIYGNFNTVQRELYNVQKHHLKHYKELPDLEPIEKLINEKRMTPWAAYQEWVGPMEKERVTAELKTQLTKEITERLQNEHTRTGVNSFLLQNRSSVTGEEITSPLDESLRERLEAAPPAPDPTKSVAPTEMDLMADFIGTMRNGRSGVAH
jgi:hypothetical protein